MPDAVAVLCLIRNVKLEIVSRLLIKNPAWLCK